MQSDPLIIVHAERDVNVSDVIFEINRFMDNRSLSNDFQSSEEVTEKLNIIKQSIGEYAECLKKITVTPEITTIVNSNILLVNRN